MPFTSTFYDTLPGEGVKETQWAQSAMSRGALFGVVGADDFAISAHPTTPYTVNIGPGKAWGHGVWDDATGITAVTTTAPANNAYRWDLIALRRDWQPTGGGPSALKAVAGTTSQALPDGMEKRPGIIADQPLYLVQWRGGTTTPMQVIDLRCFAGPGGVEIKHLLARSYLGYPGAAVHLDGQVHRYIPGANNVWGWATGDTGWVPITPAITSGVQGVRGVGQWSKITGCEVRLVAGGEMLQLRGELQYLNTETPTYEPGEGVAVATLPLGMRPAEQGFIIGTTNNYATTLLYTVHPDGAIRLGPGARGKRAQFNGLVPLR